MILLDTNIILYAIRHRPIEVFQRLNEVRLGEVGILMVTNNERELSRVKGLRVEN